MSLLMHLHQHRERERTQRAPQRQALRSHQQHPGSGVAPASARGELLPRQYRRVAVRHIQSGLFQGFSRYCTGVHASASAKVPPRQQRWSTGWQFGQVSCMLQGNACASTRGELPVYTQVVTIGHDKQTVDFCAAGNSLHEGWRQAASHQQD